MSRPARLAALVLSLALVGPAWADQGAPIADPAGPSAPAQNAADTATVKVPTLHLRSGPGTEYKVIGELRQGESVRPVSVREGWFEVEIPSGLAVFVSDKYVDETGIVKVGRLNVRPRPSQDVGAMGVVTQGTRLQILSRKDGWLAIAPPAGIHAWVSQEFLIVPEALEAKLKSSAVQSPRPAQVSAAPEESAAKDPESKPAARTETEVPIAPVASPGPNPYKVIFDQALEQYSRELSKGLVGADLSTVTGLLDRVISESRDENLIRGARAAKKRCDRVLGLQREYREATRAMERALQPGVVTGSGADRSPPPIRAAEPMAVSARKLIDESSFVAVGHVDGVGKFFGREGSHVLVKGGQTVAWLYLPTGRALNLNRYIGKRVGVRGRTGPARDGRSSVVEVAEIVVLSE